MKLKLITVKETYELKMDDIKASELLNQIQLRRPEQMIVVGKSEGAPYTIGIKPLHLVGYELIPEVMEKVSSDVVPAQETNSLKQEIEIEKLKAELEVLKASAVKRGRPKNVTE